MQKNTKDYTKYTINLLDYYSNQNVSPIHIKLVDDFFKPLPENYAKYMFKVCVETLTYFPKVAELNKIFDNFSKRHNKGKFEKEKIYNKDKCSICNNTGTFIYYKNKQDEYLNNDQYFKNYSKNRVECKQYMGICNCEVGRTKQSTYFRNFEDIFPNGYVKEKITHSDEDMKKAELILKNPSILFQ